MVGPCLPFAGDLRPVATTSRWAVFPRRARGTERHSTLDLCRHRDLWTRGALGRRSGADCAGDLQRVDYVGVRSGLGVAARSVAVFAIHRGFFVDGSRPISFGISDRLALGHSGLCAT